MSILAFLLLLVGIGVALYFFNVKVTAIDPKIKWLINGVVFVAVIVWTLQVFGLLDAVWGPTVPRVR